MIKTITVRRIHNLGSGESRTLEMTADLDPSESEKKQILSLIRKCDFYLLSVEVPDFDSDDQ